MKNKDNSQTIFNILSQIVTNGTNFVLIMIFTRFLSTENYGIVSLYQAYVLFFSVIIGINTQGTIGTGFNHFEEKEHSNYLASIFTLSLMSFIIICLLILVFIKFFSSFSTLSFSLIILMLFHSLGVFCFNFITIKYVYQREAKKGFFVSLCISILMILFSIISMNFSSKFSDLYMIRILGLAIPYILCIFYVSKDIYQKDVSIKNYKKYFSFCLPICIPLVFHSLSYILLSQTDKIMLQKLTNDLSVVGIYSFIVTYVHILNSIYTALNNTWVSLYYKYLKNDEYDTLKARSKRYMTFFTILVCGFMLLSPEVVKILADKRYWESLSLVPVISLSIFLVFMYSFAINFELYNQDSKKIALGSTFTAIINMALNFVFIKKYGMLGAAIASLISYLLLFLFHSYCANKINKISFPYKFTDYANSFIIVITCSIIFYLSLNIFYIRFIIAILLGIYLIIDLKKNKTFF